MIKEKHVENKQRILLDSEQSVTFITSRMKKKKRNANKSRRMLSKKKPHLKIIKVVYLQKINRWGKWIYRNRRSGSGDLFNEGK